MRSHVYLYICSTESSEAQLPPITYFPPKNYYLKTQQKIGSINNAVKHKRAKLTHD